MAVTSAGILLHRAGADGLEVLLVHPGGPFWAKKDAGAWSIPKGEIEADEEPLVAARREFAEELGFPAPATEALPLGEVRLRSGKRILAWSLEGDADVSHVVSNLIEVRVGGRQITIPEVDRADWFTVDVAREKLNPGQVPLVDRLKARLDEAVR